MRAEAWIGCPRNMMLMMLVLTMPMSTMMTLLLTRPRIKTFRRRRRRRDRGWEVGVSIAVCREEKGSCFRLRLFVLLPTQCARHFSTYGWIIWAP